MNYSFADAITEIKSKSTLLGCSGTSYQRIIVQNDETTSITITAIDAGVEKTYPVAAGAQAYINGCICEDITATGNFTIILKEYPC